MSYPPHRTPPPDRIRRIAGGLAFVPNDFLHRGLFASRSHAERSLYFFLVLAGDRNGVSFYAYDRICDALELTQDEYLVVRKSLIDKDLIALDGRRFQILSLPPAPILPPRCPLVTQEDFNDHDPATIQHISGRLSIAADRHVAHRAATPRSIQTTQRSTIRIQMNG